MIENENIIDKLRILHNIWYYEVVFFYEQKSVPILRTDLKEKNTSKTMKLRNK